MPVSSLSFAYFKGACQMRGESRFNTIYFTAVPIVHRTLPKWGPSSMVCLDKATASDKEASQLQASSAVASSLGDKPSLAVSNSVLNVSSDTCWLHGRIPMSSCICRL